MSNKSTAPDTDKRPVVVTLDNFGVAPYNRNKIIRNLRMIESLGATVIRLPVGTRLKDTDIRPDHFIMAGSTLMPGSIDHGIYNAQKFFKGAGTCPQSIIFLGKFAMIKPDYFEENPIFDFHEQVAFDITWGMKSDVTGELPSVVKASGPNETHDLVRAIFPDQDLSEIEPQDSFGFTELDPDQPGQHIRDAMINNYILQTGCNNKCAYCSLRSLRPGEYCSTCVPHERAIDDLRRFRAEHPEQKYLTLSGRNVGLYNDNGYRLHDLIPVVDEMGFEQVILHFFAPSQLDNELAEIIANSRSFNAIHTTTETCSPRLAKAIGRDGQLEKIDDFLGIVRSKKPDFAWSTTLLAGLPGETDGDQEITRDYVKKHHGLVYGTLSLITESVNSRRADLPIAQMLGQLSEEEKQAHLEYYLQLQREQMDEVILRMVKDFLDPESKTRIVNYPIVPNSTPFVQHPMANAAYVHAWLFEGEPDFVPGQEVRLLPMEREYLPDEGNLLSERIIACQFDSLERWFRRPESVKIIRSMTEENQQRLIDMIKPQMRAFADSQRAEKVKK